MAQQKCFILKQGERRSIKKRLNPAGGLVDVSTKTDYGEGQIVRHSAQKSTEAPELGGIDDKKKKFFAVASEAPERGERSNQFYTFMEVADNAENPNWETPVVEQYRAENTEIPSKFQAESCWEKTFFFYCNKS